MKFFRSFNYLSLNIALYYLPTIAMFRQEAVIASEQWKNEISIDFMANNLIKEYSEPGSSKRELV